MNDHEERSVHEMVKGLHQRFTGIERRFSELESRLDAVERETAAEKAHLEKHESESEIQRGHIIETLNSLVTWNRRFDDRLSEHMRQDEDDRKELIRVLQAENRNIQDEKRLIQRDGVKNLMWVLGQAIAVTTLLFGMLWATGVTGA